MIRLKKNSRADLKKHLDGEEPGEDVVEVGEDVVLLAVLLHRVLGGQGDAAQDDDDHDERLEAGDRHDAVDQDPDPGVDIINSTRLVISTVYFLSNGSFLFKPV